MMNLHELVVALGDDDVTKRDKARYKLLSQDEAVIGALVDEFYAGVSVAVGTALLDVIGEIGGYEATAALRDVLDDSAAKSEWKGVARQWLLHDGFI